MAIKNKVLFIGPLPPPVDGQSKASGQALHALKDMGASVAIVNTNRDSLERNICSQIKRTFRVIEIFFDILAKRFRCDLIYISIAESHLGNIKDIMIYTLLLGKIDRVIIHMLGGSGMNKILNETTYLSKLNGVFMKKMGGVIVEGEHGYKVFGKYFNQSNIHIVNNFADDYLMTTTDQVFRKFEKRGKIQIVYLSNLIKEKGCWDLLDGYTRLPHSVKSRYSLKFVGGFPSDKEKLLFLSKISNQQEVEYLGKFIDGEDKLSLYLNSHIFCLPTYYPYEGQPISILEAYSTGCAVITTSHGGIPNIFTENINGFLVEGNNPESISRVLINIVDDFDGIRRMALNNAKEACSKYRADAYRRNISKVFKSIL